MPDRTQMLLGLERFFLGSSEGHSASSEFLHPKGPWVRYDDVAALLSQPEHQGDEETDRARADRLEVECRELEDANRSLAKMRDAALEGNLAASQPPAPVLSDEEREKLGVIASFFEGMAEEARDTGAITTAEIRESQAAFLRNLAQEHRGEENEELTMIALALYNQGIEDCTPERGVELLIERFYAQRGEVGRLRGELQRRQEKAEAERRAGDVSFYSEIRKTVDSILPPAAAQPPAGEVERLRERLLRHVEVADQALDPAYGEVVRADTARDRLASVRELLSSPLSDSQGDQERCPSCGSTEREGTYCSNAWHKRPDCNPAPTQQDEYAKALEGLPADLVTALQEPGVFVPQDSSVFKLIAEWADAPSNTASGFPAPTQVEGDAPLVIRQEDFDEALASPEVQETLGRARALRQPEGGDEEDWPEIYLARRKAFVTPIEGVEDPPGPLRICEEPDAECGPATETRRYVPATSQDSSGLEEIAEEQKAYLVTRLRKAEAVRDRLQESARIAHEEEVRLTAAAEQGRQRAETALEELAKELAEEADGSEELRSAALKSGTATAGNDALVHAFARDALRLAASLAREKAAELKEGER